MDYLDNIAAKQNPTLYNITKTEEDYIPNDIV